MSKGFKGNSKRHGLNAKGISNDHSFNIKAIIKPFLPKKKPKSHHSPQLLDDCGQVAITPSDISIYNNKGILIRRWTQEDWKRNPSLVPKIADQMMKARDCDLPNQFAHSKSFNHLSEKEIAELEKPPKYTFRTDHIVDGKSRFGFDDKEKAEKKIRELKHRYPYIKIDKSFSSPQVFGYQKLLTKETEKKIPNLYTTEGVKTQDKMIVAHFFSPYTGWDWYITEGEWVGTDGMPVRETGKPKHDYLMFGYVKGQFPEWGYVSMNELKSAKGMGGKLPLVERDMHWKPRKFNEVQNT